MSRVFSLCFNDVRVKSKLSEYEGLINFLQSKLDWDEEDLDNHWIKLENGGISKVKNEEDFNEFVKKYPKGDIKIILVEKTNTDEEDDNEDTQDKLGESNLLGKLIEKSQKEIFERIKTELVSQLTNFNLALKESKAFEEKGLEFGNKIQSIENKVNNIEQKLNQLMNGFQTLNSKMQEIIQNQMEVKELINKKTEKNEEIKQINNNNNYQNEFNLLNRKSLDNFGNMNQKSPKPYANEEKKGNNIRENMINKNDFSIRFNNQDNFQVEKISQIFSLTVFVKYNGKIDRVPNENYILTLQNEYIESEKKKINQINLREEKQIDVRFKFPKEIPNNNTLNIRAEIINKEKTIASINKEFKFVFPKRPNSCNKKPEERKQTNKNLYQGENDENKSDNEDNFKISNEELKKIMQEMDNDFNIFSLYTEEELKKLIIKHKGNKEKLFEEIFN